MLRAVVFSLVLIGTLAEDKYAYQTRWDSDCGYSQFADAGRELPDPGPVCPGRTPGEYIVCGWEARVHEFPYQGLLYYFGSLRCGAVLITPDYVLTAAHCTSNIGASSLQIGIGEHQRNSPPSERQIYQVAQVINHPNYSPSTIQHDIAVLRLTTSVVYGDHANPACQPGGGGNEYAGQTCHVSGWGSTRSGGSVTQELRYTNKPVMSYAACQASQSGILSGMLCAGEPPYYRDACQGDSGGPLAVKVNGKLEVVGLVSWGYGCAGSTPGVYNEVYSYVDWVNSVIG
uniref:Serine protease n=1 Tax=Arenicola cristata TaxID=273048 RepID=A0A077B6E7_ARECR|nr:serine protease [Arenicola cristata]